MYLCVAYVYYYYYLFIYYATGAAHNTHIEETYTIKAYHSASFQ